MMKILRTLESCFEKLPNYNFEPRYATIKDDNGTAIRIHSIDEGPREAEPILLTHGNPSWSYIYRKMIPLLLKSGRRVIAVGLVGPGRSDKPARFDRIVAANTGVPQGDGGNKVLFWWLKIMKWMPFPPFAYAFKKSINNPDLSEAEYHAYSKSTFPKRRYQAGILSFPQLISIFPGNPGVPQNQATWEKLKKIDKPGLTLFGRRDPVSNGWQKKFINEIKGAAGQNHKIIEGGGHFIQKDKPEELVAEIIPFLEVR
jgi:haloalkane dehalogenase